MTTSEEKRNQAMSQAAAEPVHATIVPVQGDPYKCQACGHQTVSRLAVIVAMDGMLNVWAICPSCIQSDGVTAHIKAQIEQVGLHGTELEDFMRRLVVPTSAEWEAEKAQMEEAAEEGERPFS